MRVDVCGVEVGEGQWIMLMCGMRGGWMVCQWFSKLARCLLYPRHRSMTDAIEAKARRAAEKTVETATKAKTTALKRKQEGENEDISRWLRVKMSERNVESMSEGVSLSDVEPDLIAEIENELQSRAQNTHAEAPTPNSDVIASFEAKAGAALASLTAEDCKDSRSVDKAMEEIMRCKDLGARTEKHCALTAGEEKLLAQCIQALKDGDFDIRGPLGQAFQRAHKKGTPANDLLKAQKTLEQKSSFRREWAASTGQRLEQKKTHTRRFEEVNADHGVYMPWRCVWRAEGDDEDGRIAAIKYCSKAAAMGGRWTRWNEMTERREYLHIRKEYTNTFTEAWELFSSEWSEYDVKGKGNGVADVAAGSGQPALPSAPKGKLDAISADTTPDKKNAGKTSVASDMVAGMMTNAGKVKADFMQVMASASQLVKAIQSGDAKWKPFNNESNVGELIGLVKALQNAVTDGKLEEYLLTDLKKLRKDIGAETLMKEIGRFNELRKPIDAVSSSVKSLIRMQAAYLKRSNA